MNPIKVLWVLITLLAAAPSWAAPKDIELIQQPIAASPPQSKVALVIGINNYQLARPLQVSSNDARDFAAYLRDKMNFPPGAITTLTDGPGSRLTPTRSIIKREIQAFLASVDEDSEVVFFFSGHGARVNNQDWLAPQDMDPADVADSCINYNDLRSQLETKRPRRVLLIVDACRNLYEGGKAAGGSGFGSSKGSSEPQFAELRSCEATELSQEAPDFKRSVFTHYLLQGLNGAAVEQESGNVTFDSLRSYVRGNVRQYVREKINGQQNPVGYATLGAMVLAKTAAPRPIVIPTPVPAPVLAPIDNSIRLKISSTPPGATVYIDDVDSGEVTPCEIVLDNVLMQKFAIRVGLTRDGYQKFTQKISVERGKTLPQAFKLEPERPATLPTPQPAPAPVPTPVPVQPVSPAPIRVPTPIAPKPTPIPKPTPTPSAPPVPVVVVPTPMAPRPTPTPLILPPRPTPTPITLPTASAPAVITKPNVPSAAATGENVFAAAWKTLSAQSQAPLFGLSENSSVFATGHEGAVKVWDAQTNRSQELPFVGQARAIAVSPDGKIVAIGGTGRSVQLFDAQSGQAKQSFAQANRVVLSLAFAPDGQSVAMGNDNGQIQIVDLQSGEVARTISAHTKEVLCLAFSRDGDKLISGSPDGRIGLWNPRSGQSLRAFDQGGIITSVAVSPDGQKLAAAFRFESKRRQSANGFTLKAKAEPPQIRILDISSGKTLNVLPGTDTYYTALAFAPEGQFLLTSSGKGTVTSRPLP